MIDAVFDTVIFVRGLLNPGGACGELLFRRRHAYRLVVSRPVVDEILSVISRPEITRKFSFVARARQTEIRRFLDEAVWVEPAEIGPVCRDPNDDVFIATAVAAGAAVLVSEDRDLLALGSHAGVRILDAADFLATLADLD